jgi:signal transduction histidine kinase
LRESNRLKDEFLATLSHELRTPLNVILGWTRMLLTDQLSDHTRRHALELIERNAHAQAQLVNDLVDMSRMTTGTLQVELEPLPVVPALEAALESVRPAADAKGIYIHTSWDVRDANVLADPTRLQQILWNLLSNAVKFTPNGGRISVTAEHADRRIRITSATRGSASTRSSFLTCSTGSGRPTAPRRAATAASVSGWRSCTISCACTAARSKSRARGSIEAQPLS